MCADRGVLDVFTYGGPKVTLDVLLTLHFIYLFVKEGLS